MTNNETISAEFPYESRYVSVHGSQMHYVDEGEGDPILFLHGNPTSSYLWRNIIPHLTPHARCIAPDLIGMGKSDKPDLDYRLFDHIKYIEAFIEALELKNVTLVIHDWGSALGFHYAMRNEANIKGIACMEAMAKPLTWEDFPPEHKTAFRLMRMPLVGGLMISVLNMFLGQVLPGSIHRTLSPEETARYNEPFPSVSSRKPVRVFPCEIPIDGKPADIHRLMADYSEKLQQSELPKLLFVATPGAIILDGGRWCQQHLKNLKVVDVGEGNHFLQEDHPHLIGRELAEWFRALS